MAVVAIMTGPAGSTETPTAGFTGSFGEAVVVLRVLRHPAVGAVLVRSPSSSSWLWTLWLSRGQQIKDGFSNGAVGRRAQAHERRTVRWSIALVLIVSR